MLLRSLNRVVAAVFLFPALFTVVTYSQTPGSNSYPGIQIDAPAGGHIRIENQFGEVKIAVWNEKFVSVSATVAGRTPLARSPVVIENRPRLLAISIVRRRTDPVVAIELAVKIPENARV